MPSAAMMHAQLVAQETNLPDGGGGQIVFWLIGAAVILGLWFVIARSRKRSYNAYWDRRRKEQQLKDDDPDMAKPEPLPPPDLAVEEDEDGQDLQATDNHDS